MKCPLLLAANTSWEGFELREIDDCLQAECAWWEEQFGKCCIAVDAHLKGVEDRLLEREIARRGG